MTLRLPAIGLGLAIFWGLLWPGDIPWINDEPLLITHALEANRLGVLGASGFTGSTGLHYGSLGVWYYQFFLSLTHDLIWISFLTSALFLGVLALTLVKFQQQLQFPKYFWGLVFLSPYIYLFHRLLWDNPLLILICGGFFYFVLRFTQRPSGQRLALVLLLGVAGLHVHNMWLFTLAPTTVLLIYDHLPWFKRNLWPASLSFGAAGILAIGYTWQLFNSVSAYSVEGGFIFRNLFTPILSTQIFGPLGFWGTYLPEFWESLPAPLVLLVSALAASALIATGFFILGIHRTFRVHDPLARLSAACILAATLYFVFTGLPYQPHYANGLWFPIFYLIWFGWEKSRQKWLLKLQVAAMALLFPATIVFIHLNGGGRTLFYGPTLGNQMEVAETYLRNHRGARIQHKVSSMGHFPHGFQTLRNLSTSKSRKNWRRTVSIQFRDSKQTGFIELHPHP